MLFRQIIHEDLGCASYFVADREAAVASRVSRPPRHLNATPEEEAAARAAKAPKQSSLWSETTPPVERG